MTTDNLTRHFRNATCLVTGGAGFIGSNLVRSLLEKGARVAVLDNFVAGKRDNLPDSPHLSVVEGDVDTTTRLPEMVAASDYVFHLAAQVGNIKSIEETETDARTNVLGSVRLFQACRHTAVKKVVYSSSSAIFGEAERIPIDEEHRQQPASFYALSKQTGEKYALLAESMWGVPTVCLRYFNVFGLPMEYNEYTGVISIFFDRLRLGEPLVIFGDGEQCRDFVYVSDVAQANMRAAMHGKAGRVYNIGSGEVTTIGQLAETMSSLAGGGSEVSYKDFRAGEVRRSVADISRARAELDYMPTCSLRSGLADMWKRINNLTPADDPS